ncbi:MAG: ATP-binding cassette domain-containing protein [Ilumatobacter sp.]|nr:ATP-binding cassette domain-containing protein [Ilumatobacter sp.]
MIDVRSLVKRYGDTTVLDCPELTIDGAGVTALVGANGAGKSTLLTIAGRLLEPTSGTVLIDGHDVSTAPSRQLAARVAILRQENVLAVRLTVRELVEFGRFPYSQGRLTDEDHHLVDRALMTLDLHEFAPRRLDELSGGQRQRAFIAAVVAQDTDHVLLDEPLNNLDLRHAAQSMAMIRRLADDFGKTVVVVLHDINVAAHHADRIVAMRDGRIVADGTPNEVVVASTMRDVFGLDVEITEHRGRPVVLHFVA